MRASVCRGLRWQWLGLLIFRVFCLLRLSLWDSEYALLWWLDKGLAYVNLNCRDLVERFNDTLMECAARTVSLLWYTGSLLVVVMYTMGVVGVLILRNAIEAVNTHYAASNPPVDATLTNFASLGHALVALFQVMMENNWNDILYTSMAARGAIAAVYFVGFFVLCGYFFTFIFTVIILNSVSKEYDGTRAQLHGCAPHTHTRACCHGYSNILQRTSPVP